MTVRTVAIGAVAYRPVGGDQRSAWGYLGQEVDVHDDDLARFDRATGVHAPFVEASASDAPAVSDPEGGKPEPTVADLKAEIEARNAQRTEDNQIVPASGKKADLIAALAADDAAGLATVD